MTEENIKGQCPRCGGSIAKGAATPSELPCSCASKPKEWIRKTLTREMEREISVDQDKFPLKRYKPLSLIGSGGNGTVYCCRDRLLRKKVAIKVITDATSNHLVAFQKEAKATSKLIHPNIVAVLDFGVMEGGTPYMVMELFEGAELSKAIRTKGPLPIPTALAVFSRVCDGLTEAHRMGVFHRDINNSNILVSDLDSESPAVRIIDFGVARLRQEQDESLRTQGLTLVGTPHYMSPDQAAGKPFDERSEIYSVGCALFEALTGVPPYSGESALEIINQHAIAPVPKLSEKNPKTYFPSDLESIVASCLAKDPNQRPQSMADLGNALNNLTISMTLSNPTMRLELAPKRKESRKKATVLMVVISTVLLLILFVSAIGHNNNKEVVVRKTAVAKVARLDDARSKWRRTLIGGNMTAVVADEMILDSDLDPIIKLNVPAVIIKSGRITDAGLHKMRGMPLKYLNLAHTPLDDSAIPHIANFKDLNSLVLSDTDVTDSGIKGLSGLTLLEKIDLDGVDGFTDKGVDLVISQWPNLQDLNVSNTSVTSAGVQKLDQFRNLDTLGLARLTLSDDAMEVILNLPKLEKLSLTEVRFAPKFLDRIPKMTNLRFLSIGCLPGLDADSYAALREKMSGHCEVEMNYDPKVTMPTVEPLFELMNADEK